LPIAVHTIVLRTPHVLTALTIELIEAVTLTHVIVASASEQLGASVAFIEV
jgi:hypothetical protein